MYKYFVAYWHQASYGVGVSNSIVTTDNKMDNMETIDKISRSLEKSKGLVHKSLSIQNFILLEDTPNE